MALLKIKSGLLMAIKKAITTTVVLIRPKAVSLFPQPLLPTTASGCGVASPVKSTGASGLGVVCSVAEFDTLKVDGVGVSNSC